MSLQPSAIQTCCKKALDIRGGVVDRLLSDNVSVKLQTKQDLVLEPYYKKSNDKKEKNSEPKKKMELYSHHVNYWSYGCCTV
ncbi:hypothetical protein GCM10020331_045740 [Ectobacillus funiculus]